MAANSSMSVTHRLIPEALSLTGLPVHKVYSPNPPPPASQCLSQFHLIYPVPYLPRHLCLPSPRSHSLPVPLNAAHHTQKHTETPTRRVWPCTETAALSAPASVRSSINFVISSIPLLPLLLECLPRTWTTPPTRPADAGAVYCHRHAFIS